jgi:23S rRNA G2445 N2-methylase RlmL
MGAISVRLPDSLHELVRDVAAQDHVSLNQFIASAVAEKVSALRTERYIAERAQRGSLQAFKSALAAVPDVPPVAPDERL